MIFTAFEVGWWRTCGSVSTSWSKSYLQTAYLSAQREDGEEGRGRACRRQRQRWEIGATSEKWERSARGKNRTDDVTVKTSSQWAGGGCSRSHPFKEIWRLSLQCNITSSSSSRSSFCFVLWQSCSCDKRELTDGRRVQGLLINFCIYPPYCLLTWLQQRSDWFNSAKTIGIPCSPLTGFSSFLSSRDALPTQNYQYLTSCEWDSVIHY